MGAGQSSIKSPDEQKCGRRQAIRGIDASAKPRLTSDNEMESIRSVFAMLDARYWADFLECAHLIQNYFHESLDSRDYPSEQRLERLAPLALLVEECRDRMQKSRERMIEEVGKIKRRQNLDTVLDDGLPTYEVMQYSDALEKGSEREQRLLGFWARSQVETCSLSRNVACMAVSEEDALLVDTCTSDDSSGTAHSVDTQTQVQSHPSCQQAALRTTSTDIWEESIESSKSGKGPFRFRALYDFDGNAGELSFRAGQIIHVAVMGDDDWVKGVYWSGGTLKGGLLPRSFVAILQATPIVPA